MPESTGRKSQRAELFSQTSFFTPSTRIASSRDTACCIQLWQSSFPAYPMVQGEFACVIPFADSPKGRSCVIEGPCQQCLRPHSDPKRLSNRTFWRLRDTQSSLYGLFSYTPQGGFIYCQSSVWYLGLKVYINRPTRSVFLFFIQSFTPSDYTYS